MICQSAIRARMAEGAGTLRGVRLGLCMARVSLAIARGALRLGGCDGLRVGRRIMSFKTAGQMRDRHTFGIQD